MKNLALILTLFLLLSHFVSGQQRDLNQLVAYCAEAPTIRYFSDPENGFAEAFELLKNASNNVDYGIFFVSDLYNLVLDIAFPALLFSEMLLNAISMAFWGLMWFVGAPA